jgi:hypothetical protein
MGKALTVVLGKPARDPLYHRDISALLRSPGHGHFKSIVNFKPSFAQELFYHPFDLFFEKLK